jgi:hypothetical protein
LISRYRSSLMPLICRLAIFDLLQPPLLFKPLGAKYGSPTGS